MNENSDHQPLYDRRKKLLNDEHLPHLLAADGDFVRGHTKRDQPTHPPTWEERKRL
jgi:hypothetical protein